MILDERENRSAICWEIWHHIGLADDKLSIQDVVVSVVAMVDDKGEVDHESCRVALAVRTGIGFVGWQTVVGKKFVLALAVDDDAPAGALHLRGDVNPTADVVNLLILKRVRVD